MTYLNETAEREDARQAQEGYRPTEEDWRAALAIRGNKFPWVFEHARVFRKDLEVRIVSNPYRLSHSETALLVVAAAERGWVLHVDGLADRPGAVRLMVTASVLERVEDPL